MRFDFNNGADILRRINVRASLRKARGEAHLPFHKITSSSALHGKAKRSFKISFLREEKAYI